MAHIRRQVRSGRRGGRATKFAGPRRAAKRAGSVRSRFGYAVRRGQSACRQNGFNRGAGFRRGRRRVRVCAGRQLRGRQHRRRRQQRRAPIGHASVTEKAGAAARGARTAAMTGAYRARERDKTRRRRAWRRGRREGEWRRRWRRRRRDTNERVRVIGRVRRAGRGWLRPHRACANYPSCRGDAFVWNSELEEGVHSGRFAWRQSERGSLVANA